MWYIRFLKLPSYRIAPSQSRYGLTQAIITFTITITTDLGDEFFAGDGLADSARSLTANLVRAKVQDASTKSLPLNLAKSHFSWPSGKRSATHHFSATLRENVPVSSLRVFIEQRDGQDDLQSVLLGQIPRVVSVWSDFFDSESGKSTSGRVQRRFPVGDRKLLNVWEETGESIARHIWDAGIATWLYVLNSTMLSRKTYELSKVLENMPKHMNILEIGSGCGIGGLAFALTLPDDSLGRKCDVLLTDVPEAMPILEFNISQNQYANGCTVGSQVLNWDDDESLALLITKSKFDIVLVSDCTYNCDSCPALVRSLSAIAKASNPFIIVDMKVRHESESVFFTLMEEAGFGTMRDGRFLGASHDEIILPHRDGNYSPSEGDQKIDIYIFRMTEAERCPVKA